MNNVAKGCSISTFKKTKSFINLVKNNNIINFKQNNKNKKGDSPENFYIILKGKVSICCEIPVLYRL